MDANGNNNPNINALKEIIASAQTESINEADEEPLNIKLISSLESKSVLIAEDNLMAQQLVARMITRMKYRFIITNDGVECVDAYTTNPSEISVIILDGLMPKMGGEEAFLKIREFEKLNNLHNIPVLFVTADADAECQKRVLSLGIDTVLIKPFTFSQLKTALTKPTASTTKGVSRASTIHFESLKRSDIFKVIKPLRSLTSSFGGNKFNDTEKSIFLSTLRKKTNHTEFKNDIKKPVLLDRIESNLTKNLIMNKSSNSQYSPKKIVKAPPLSSLTLQASRLSRSGPLSPPPLASLTLEKVRNQDEQNNTPDLPTQPNGSFSFSNSSDDSKVQFKDKDNEVASYFSSVRSIAPNIDSRQSFNLDKRGSLIKPDKIYGTVLCADDNPMNQKLVARFLNVIGYDYVIANDGQECLDIYSSNPSKFCSILMDCSMPIKDGYEASLAIREFEKSNNLPKIMICALTADNSGDNEKKCFASGMDCFLTKPASSKQLAEVLHTPLQAADFHQPIRSKSISGLSQNRDHRSSPLQ